MTDITITDPSDSLIPASAIMRAALEQVVTKLGTIEAMMLPTDDRTICQWVHECRAAAKMALQVTERK